MVSEKPCSKELWGLGGIGMITLPNVPYSMRKNQSSEIRMKGINYTNMISDGDITDSNNIVADEYPYISAKKDNSLISEGVRDAIWFGGKLCYIKDQYFYYDGEAIDRLVNGEKQFAIVNTKLCIFPDKVYFDLPTKSLKRMGSLMAFRGADFSDVALSVAGIPATSSEGYGGKFEGNKFTVNVEKEISLGNGYVSDRTIISLGEKVISSAAVFEKGGETITLYSTTKLNDGETYVFICKTLGTATISTHFKATVKTCVPAAGAQTTVVLNAPIEVPGATYTIDVYRIADNSTISDLAVGDMVDIKTTVITTQSSNIWIRGLSIISIDNLGITFSEPLEFSEPIMSVGIWAWGWEFSLYNYFAVGQQILFANSIFNDGAVFTISEVASNSITVEETFSTGYLKNSDKISAFILPNSMTKATPGKLENYFNIGDTVFIRGTQHNNISFTIDEIDGNTFILDAPVFKEEQCDFIIIERKIPDLDFICECDNRLYGCSNKDRTIYASALGDPTNFFTYVGTSDDAYAVAVGSEGDFTACTRYGSDVLFWKEDKLHKLVGDFPAEYALYSYDIEGVQKGSEKSTCIVNEVLYYKGNRGIYAYTGDVPSLISANFGDRAYTQAVGGSDGDKYYISMVEDSDTYTYTYLIKFGIWMLEEKKRYTQFARKGKELFGICDGNLYHLNSGEVDKDTEWMIQFCPMYETMGGRKTYSRLLLRVSIPDEAYVKVETRMDDGRWLSCGKIVGAHNRVVPIKIPINKCDKFEFRISGKGDCKILGIIREFFVGGES